MFDNNIPKFKYVDDNIVKNFFVKKDNKVLCKCCEKEKRCLKSLSKRCGVHIKTAVQTQVKTLFSGSPCKPLTMASTAASAEMTASQKMTPIRFAQARPLSSSDFIHSLFSIAASFAFFHLTRAR